MPVRLVSLLLVLLAVPAVSQQSSVEERISQRIQSHEQRISQIVSGTTSTELDAGAARLRAIHHDTEELSALSASVQSDLQQLRKGLLAKDLDEKLKKMEKLSKKLRQEMEP